MPSLRKNFMWTLAGNLVYGGCQWLMIVLMAKLGTPSMVGLFALGMAIAIPVFSFTNLQLRTVQATDAREDFVFRDYLTLRLIMSGIGYAAIGFVAVGMNYSKETAWTICATGMAKAIESLSDILYGFLQLHERMDLIAWSLIFKGMLSLMATVLVLFYTGDIVWTSWALAAAWLVVLIVLDFPMVARLIRSEESDSCSKNGPFLLFRFALRAKLNLSSRQWNLATLIRLFRLSLPLAFTFLLVMLSINIPKYFMDSYSGTYELGIFAALSNLPVVGSRIVDALSQSATPRLARLWAQGNLDEFRVLIAKLVVMGIFLGVLGIVVAWIAGREILSLLYTAEYAERQGVLVTLMVAEAILYIGSFLACGVMAARVFKIHVLPHSFNIILTLVLCYLLVPGHGSQGAAEVLLWTRLPLCAAYAAILILITIRKSKPVLVRG